ncbi:MAG: THUMP domain-containing protein [Candidatus Heimdallarchaeaceae archaeon]
MSEFNQLLLLRFSEIGIKSQKTRKWLTNELVKHIRYVLEFFGLKEFEIIREYSRIYVKSKELAKVEKIVTSLVPGIRNVSKVFHCPTDINKIKLIIQKQFFKRLRTHSSFAVKVKRIGEHPFSSMELASEIGAYILETNSDVGIKVDLTSPEYTLNLEVRGEDTFIFEERSEGLGGLPVGCQGKVLILNEGTREDLSNVIQMYKRGANTITCFLKPKDEIEQHIFSTIELLSQLQPKIRKKTNTFFFNEKENVVEKILTLYQDTSSQAIVMSNSVFNELSGSIPVNIPIFVPHLVIEPDNEEIEKVISITI